MWDTGTGILLGYGLEKDAGCWTGRFAAAACRTRSPPGDDMEVPKNNDRLVHFFSKGENGVGSIDWSRAIYRLSCDGSTSPSSTYSIVWIMQVEER